MKMVDDVVVATNGKKPQLPADSGSKAPHLWNLRIAAEDGFWRNQPFLRWTGSVPLWQNTGISETAFQTIIFKAMKFSARKEPVNKYQLIFKPSCFDIYLGNPTLSHFRRKSALDRIRRLVSWKVIKPIIVFILTCVISVPRLLINIEVTW